MKTGIIICVGAIAGRVLTHVFMLITFLIRVPRYKFMFREIIAWFLTGGIGQNYIELLRESHLEPWWFDKMLHILGRIFECSLLGGIILVIIGFISK
jgi:hypothetical protein